MKECPIRPEMIVNALKENEAKTKEKIRTRRVA
jgi:hypothetical protein